MMEQMKYLETTNERDFFISANLLFEKLFDDKITYENKKPKTHALRMEDLFSRLEEFLDEPMLKNIYNFLILLNRYRNELAHNFEAEKELSLLKEELLSEIRSFFINSFSLSEDFKFNKENVESVLNDSINDFVSFENGKLAKNAIEIHQKLLKDIPKEDINRAIETFDILLHMQVIMIYSAFIGLLTGISDAINSSIDNSSLPNLSHS